MSLIAKQFKPNPYWINFVSKHQSNYLFLGLVTFTFPELFMRYLYKANTGFDWNGKPACITLSYDCDYPEDVEALPYLLDIMKGYEFKASFACVGYWIEKYPAIHARILEEGHEIINHTYSHPDNELLNPGRKFRECSLSEKRAEVEKCHEVCERVLGYSPIGLRIPHFKHNFKEDIYGILIDMGYVISSSTWLTNTKTAGLPFWMERKVVEFPLSTCPKHPFTVFDTWHSFHSRRWAHRFGHTGENGYIRQFERLLKIGTATNSYINIYLDPLDVPKMTRFRSMLDQIVENDLYVLTYKEFLEKCPSKILEIF